MADQELINLLKKGVTAWNGWKGGVNYMDIDIDLRRADLGKMDLREANLYGVSLDQANLQEANLTGADLRHAHLYAANLKRARLDEADLRQTNLEKADLFETHIYKADLEQAFLIEANLREADLRRANLNSTHLGNSDLAGADLREAKFIETKLDHANLSKAVMGVTIIGATDLSAVLGLDEVIHKSSTIVSASTYQQSKGKISTAFLRGCGLGDFEIESVKLYNPDLTNQQIDSILYTIHDLRARQSVQVSPLFISYSHADAAFVDRLEADFNEKGIRFWRDIHNATAGPLEEQIELAISHNPTVLVVLSENSIKSDWVEHEVRKARALQKELGRNVLCPVALDESWKDSLWPERIMEQLMEYNILDFSKWRNRKTFKEMFVRLLDGLQLFYRA